MSSNYDAEPILFQNEHMLTGRAARAGYLHFANYLTIEDRELVAWDQLSMAQRSEFLRLTDYFLEGMQTEAAHELLAHSRAANGWVYAEVENNEALESPWICSWDNLEEEYQLALLIFHNAAIVAWKQFGMPQVTPLPTRSVPL